MEVPSSYLDGYSNAVNSVVKRAQTELKAALSLVDYSQPMEELRRELIGIMEDYCSAASSVGARVSAEFYDELRRRVTGKRDSLLSLQDMRDPTRTRKAVLALLRELEDGELEDVPALVDELTNHLEVEVKRGVALNIMENARTDPGDVRFARVPQGETTCDFCIMLASRGPIYYTEESAGAFSKFHYRCDCKVVPFFNTESAGLSRRSSPMTIEGYDPDALYKQYQETMRRKREWHREHDHK